MESPNVYCKDPSLNMQTIWPKNEKRSTLFHLSFTHFLGDSTHTKNQILSTQSVTILSTKNVLSRHLLTNTTITTKLVGISYFSEEPSHRQISFDAISLVRIRPWSSMPVTENSSLLFSSCHLEIIILGNSAHYLENSRFFACYIPNSTCYFLK